MDVPPFLYSAPAYGFYAGLLVGLLIAFFIWKASFSRDRAARAEKRRLETELKDLQGHLHTQLKINATGSETLQKQIEELRLQNENLRVNLASLQQKPGRAELRQLQVLDQAVSRMREQAPGFATAWERALREAEAEVEAGEGGLKKLMRRVLPTIGHSSGNDPERDRRAPEDDA